MSPTSHAASLGEEVKRLRSEAGWTQKRLNELTGLSQAYIAQIEGGKRVTITAETLFRLCGAFKVDCNHFARYFKVLPLGDPPADVPPAPAAEPEKPSVKKKGKRK